MSILRKLKRNLRTWTRAKHFEDIPAKIIKQSAEMFSKLDCENTDLNTRNIYYLCQFRCADVKPIFTTNSQNEKESYSLVNILSNKNICMYDPCTTIL